MARHHFIPQFHLRTFQIADKPKHIAVQDLEKGICYPSAQIKGQAQRTDLYKNQHNENRIAKLESKFAAAIQ